MTGVQTCALPILPSLILSQKQPTQPADPPTKPAGLLHHSKTTNPTDRSTNLSFFRINYQPNWPIHEPFILSHKLPTQLANPRTMPTGLLHRPIHEPSTITHLPIQPPGSFSRPIDPDRSPSMAFSTAPLSLALFNTPLQYRHSHPQAPIVPVKHRSISLLFFFFGKTNLSLCWFVCVGLFVCRCVCVLICLCGCVCVHLRKKKMRRH